MKKQFFSFSTIFTLLLILIFAASCSNKNTTETADNTDVSEEVAANNENEVVSEIDYAETNESETESTELETEEKTTTNTPTKSKKSDTKSESTVTSSTKTPTQTSNNVEKAPNQTKATPKLTSNNTDKVETAPKQPKVTNNKVETAPKIESKPGKPFSHTIWNDLLKKHVSSTGNVNYAGFKTDKAKLQAYLDLLSENAPTSKMSRNDQVAYWINAYNAFTVDLIVDNYPISSILKLDNGKTWYIKRITIGGKKYSLDDIEKKILIGQFKEPRVHFAVNCAAKSCPPLKNRAWEGSTLNSDLDRATRNFINNSTYNQIEKKSANLSQIFNWYKADFGDVNAFINKYADSQITSKTKVTYNEYNWDLNK